MALGGLIMIAAWLGVAAPPSTCARLTRALAVGDAPVASDLAPALCADRTVAFGYDPLTGLARARRALAVGEVVRLPPTVMIAAVRRGQVLTLRTAVGPVMIERRVVAVRAAGVGQPVWVRGEAGMAFATPANSATP